MKRCTSCSSPTRRALQALAWAALEGLSTEAALAVAACDRDVNFNPITPTLPTPPTSLDPAKVEPGRSLEISGSLTAE